LTRCSDNLEQRIVAEVVRRLEQIVRGQALDPRGAAGPPITDSPAAGARDAEWRNAAAPGRAVNGADAQVGQGVQRSVSANGYDRPQGAGQPETGVVSIGDAVISMRQLNQLPPGTRQVRIARRAILTPLAKDWLRERGIDWQYEGLGGANAETGRIHLAVAHVAVGSRSTKSRGGNGLGEPDVGLEPLRRLAGQAGLTVETLAAERDESLVTPVSLAVARSDERVLWITRQPMVVLCRANREPPIRAAWALDEAAVNEALRQLAANVLVCEPDRHSDTAWKRIFELLRSPCASDRSSARSR